MYIHTQKDKRELFQMDLPVNMDNWKYEVRDVFKGQSKNLHS